MKLYYVCHAGAAAWYKRCGIHYRNLHDNGVPFRLIARSQVDRAIGMLLTVYDRQCISVLYVDVPKKWLKNVVYGVWECHRDIPPGRILGELFVEE